jgi:hypothetical protein
MTRSVSLDDNNTEPANGMQAPQHRQQVQTVGQQVEHNDLSLMRIRGAFKSCCDVVHAMTLFFEYLHALNAGEVQVVVTCYVSTNGLMD